ncbi:bifunctional aldolase/short-chain dehydrogenase [Rhizobium leguminosarum]|uniref:bifunctional aldolase/short-chain dehydrogenase n=1 Tax=Rhizobium leguminosarum TaxID=384 RepID=UPI003F98017A
MKSRWNDGELASLLNAYVAKGINRDLAIRTYTTRLLGQDPELVLHGGGNTSVKTAFIDRDGSSVDVLCVKGSGWDMGTIEPQGLPAVRLDPLKAMVGYDALTDDEMVMLQRRLLMDPNAPNPSVEAILHAILPFRHIDHTHANAIVSLTNQPHGEDLVRELFPNSIIVPYVMPGFVLAKACDAAFRANPTGDGMILLKHGIFTWSDDPREAYEDMIAKIDQAERRLARGRAKPFVSVAIPQEIAAAKDIAPILRGAIAIDTGIEGAPKRLILEHRCSEKILDFCNAEMVESLVQRGNATPEHVIHIKRFGIALPAPEAGRLAEWGDTVRAAVEAYQEDYRAYFQRNNDRAGGGKTMLDPMPRVFYVAGVGLFAAGATRKNALVGADVAEATIAVITSAEGISSFEALPEADLFDIEYWSLEQVKLTKQVEKPLTRQVAIVTGAAGGLGLAIAEALRAEGAEVALIDIAEDSVTREAKRLGGIGVACDVTDPAQVDAAIARVVQHFGGVDILISNAGAAFQGRLLEVSEDVFRKAFDLNFWSHHYVARAVVRVMEEQRSGGAIVFNVSKQAVNPGADFGPYGTSKAALMALMRQYAIEHGPSGITANAVNADRIRTGLMTDQMVVERSRARGLTPEAYMRGNLVGREVTGADVAAAFIHLAKARTSTGAVITVDGGNVAAMMR